MIAILLCAGFGTRLYPITKKRPNALLNIAGRPVVDYQMDQLLEVQDLREIHVVANSRFASSFYGWWTVWRDRCAKRGIQVRLHNNGSTDDDHKLGEVGDFDFVVGRLDAPKGAIVSAGDNIYRFNLTPLWEQFRSSDESLVLAFPETHPAVLQQHTVIEFDESKHVTRVHDKPAEPPSQWVCPNLFFLQPSAVELVDDYLAEAGDSDRLAGFLAYLVERQPVRVVEMPEGSMRLHINTRYMYEKAKDVLANEPVVLG